MGRKRIDIDIAEVERLAGLGLTQREICAALGFSEDTLARRKESIAGFAGAMERGKASAAKEVSNALFEACKRKNVPAIIWYEKTRRGLTDRTQVDVTIQQELEATLAQLRAKLTPDEYAKVIGIIAEADSSPAN